MDIKTIEDFENYTIDKKGVVRNIKKNKIMAQNRYKFGYAYVHLYSRGKSKKLKVHRLLAQAFIPNPNNYPVVNHIDSNPKNNDLSNLEWCTIKHNVQHSWKEGKRTMWNKGNLKLYNFICIECGFNFQRKWKNYQYCSRKCSNNNRIRNEKGVFVIA